MILGAAIGVCIHGWCKIQYVNKGIVEGSPIGSLTSVIGPLVDLSGFHSSYEIGRRLQKYRQSNAHKIRKCFYKLATTNTWVLLRFCFVRTAPFLNITFWKSGPWSRAVSKIYVPIYPYLLSEGKQNCSSLWPPLGLHTWCSGHFLRSQQSPTPLLMIPKLIKLCRWCSSSSETELLILLKGYRKPSINTTSIITVKLFENSSISMGPNFGYHGKNLRCRWKLKSR